MNSRCHHFFQEKKWHRSKKMDKNKMSIFAIWNRKSIFDVKKSGFIVKCSELGIFVKKHDCMIFYIFEDKMI